MHTKIQVNIPYKMLLENIDFVLEKKLNPEIYFNGDALDNCREDDLHRLNALLNNNSLTATIHAPFMDLSPGGVDRKIIRATHERIDHTLSVAEIFKPHMVIFHPGYNKWFFDDNVELWLKNSLNTWSPFVKRAESVGVPIAIENIFEEEPDSLQQLISAINSPYFNFCFDTGHFHLFSKVPMEDWFIALGSSLKEVHLHDNSKKSDDHLPLGDGEIDFDLFFQLIKRYEVDPIYTIEPHEVDLLERSLQACGRYLTEMERG